LPVSSPLCPNYTTDQAVVKGKFLFLSSVPDWIDVVRPSLVFGNPLVNLSEPRSVFAVFIREGDTGLAVVNLLAPEALIASHEGLASHGATGAVDRLVVVVVRHLVALFLVAFMFPIILYYRPKSTLNLRKNTRHQRIADCRPCADQPARIAETAGATTRKTVMKSACRRPVFSDRSIKELPHYIVLSAYVNPNLEIIFKIAVSACQV